MKNYISLSKKALLLGGAFVMFTSCDDGDLADIYKGSSSGEYVSDVNWTEAANKSTETYIKYFFENAGGILLRERSIGRNRIHRKPESR